MELWSRRKFFLTSLAGSAIASAGKLFGGTRSNGGSLAALSSLAPAAQGKRPLIISSANGLHALGAGMDILKKGGDTLDAAVAAVTIVEDDPNDDSVGYGGRPKQQGGMGRPGRRVDGAPPHAGSGASSPRLKKVSRLPATVSEA